jgi:hypothetical protein
MAQAVINAPIDPKDTKNPLTSVVGSEMKLTDRLRGLSFTDVFCRLNDEWGVVMEDNHKMVPIGWLLQMANKPFCPSQAEDEKHSKEATQRKRAAQRAR